jgi:hypothetical protein
MQTLRFAETAASALNLLTEALHKQVRRVDVKCSRIITIYTADVLRSARTPSFEVSLSLSLSLSRARARERALSLSRSLSLARSLYPSISLSACFSCCHSFALAVSLAFLFSLLLSTFVSLSNFISPSLPFFTLSPKRYPNQRAIGTSGRKRSL